MPDDASPEQVSAGLRRMPSADIDPVLRPCSSGTSVDGVLYMAYNGFKPRSDSVEGRILRNA
jgi:hypothetical protein